MSPCPAAGGRTSRPVESTAALSEAALELGTWRRHAALRYSRHPGIAPPSVHRFPRAPATGSICPAHTCGHAPPSRLSHSIGAESGRRRIMFVAIWQSHIPDSANLRTTESKMTWLFLASRQQTLAEFSVPCSACIAQPVPRYSVKLRDQYLAEVVVSVSMTASSADIAGGRPSFVALRSRSVQKPSHGSSRQGAS